MAIHKSVQTALKEFQDRDFEALKSIYDFRGLSEDQIFELNYQASDRFKKPVSKAYYHRAKFTRFVELGLIEPDYGWDRDIPAIYFLTTLGVNVVKSVFKFPSNIYNGKRIKEENYKTASELRIKPKFIPHQYNLNRFALEMAKLMKENNLEYEYEDERHTSKYNQIRPDGVFYTSDCDIFLEMDMGTETEFQIKEKWKHYRHFKSSQEYYDRKKPIKIYFICENVKKVERRIRFIKRTINMNCLDLVENDFDIYVGSFDELMDTFKKTVLRGLVTKNKNNLEFGGILKNKFGMAVGKSEKYDKVLDTTHMYYAKFGDKTFAVDDSYGQPISVFQNITKFQIHASTFEVSTNSPIRFIIRINSFEELQNDLEMFGNLINGDILFTNDKLLAEAENFYDAFVTFIGSQMVCSRFADKDLKTYKKFDITEAG